MSLRLAVWDVDGTLVDSRAVILRAAQDSSRMLGLPEPDYEVVRQVVGLSLPEALQTIAPTLTQAELADFVAAYSEAFRRMHAEPGFVEPLYAGAETTLRRLKREGWLIGMATGKSRRGVERIVEMHGWADLFDTLHCADDGPGKPHPAMLECAMRATGCAPSQTVMIGDTSHDMKMALAARVRAQGVAWGFHTREEVAASGAHHVADVFAELDVELDRFAAAA